MKRSRELRPLSSEHHQALLVAFQVRKGLEGHPEAAGAPRDLPGLVSLARRFERQVFTPHTEAEEALLSDHLAPPDRERLAAEHLELRGLLEEAGGAAPGPQRAALASFAGLLERHVRWEERELFPWAEAHLDAALLARIGGGLEERLVLAGNGARGRPR
jgi:hemerythrin-like domain-containing protein